MFTVTVLFLLGAFVTTIASAMGKCPLWIPVLLTLVILMLQTFPK